MSLLAGRYETIRAIASGGMATVHLAKAVGLGGFERLVAVKVMHPHLAADPEFVAMFLDEARLAARIRHPNVVPTIDVQQSGEGLFLVMEYVEGASLRAVLRGLAAKHRRLPVDVAVRIFVEAASGLHAAHELRGADGKALRLVHRDVSPANILVGTDGVARLTDFGVARAESRISSTRGGQLKGKIPYMPPEQILGEDLDRRVDVYATGLVLWEALVGRRLFQAPNDGALLHMILSGADKSPRSFRRDVPETIDQVCMRALARKPDDRFPTAAAFADALEQAAVDADLRVASSRVVAALVTEHVAAHASTEVSLEREDEGAKDWSSSYQMPLDEPEPMPADSAQELPLAAGRPPAGEPARADAARPEPVRAAQLPPPPPPLEPALSEISSTDSHSTARAATLDAEPLDALPRSSGLRRVLGIAAAALIVGALGVVVWRVQSSGPEGATGPAASGSGAVAAPPSAAQLATTGAPSPSTGPTGAPSAEPSSSATAVEPGASATANAGRWPRTPTTVAAPTTGTAKTPAKGTTTASPSNTSAPTSPTAYRPTQL